MIYLQLFWAFFKIGALGFGGGLAIIQLIHDSIQQFAAISQEEFANIVAIAQATPGPIAVNTATYIGYQSAGVLGAFIATLGVCTPAFILVSIVCRMVTKYSESKALNGALKGVRPATVGMIAAAAITIGKPTFFTDSPLGVNFAGVLDLLPQGIDVLSIILCLVTIILIGKFKKNTFRVLILMGIIGAILGA